MKRPTQSIVDGGRSEWCDGRRFVRDFIDADTGETYAFEVGRGDWCIIEGDDDAYLLPGRSGHRKSSFQTSAG